MSKSYRLLYDDTILEPGKFYAFADHGGCFSREGDVTAAGAAARTGFVDMCSTDPMDLGVEAWTVLSTEEFIKTVGETFALDLEDYVEEVL